MTTPTTPPTDDKKTPEPTKPEATKREPFVRIPVTRITVMRFRAGTDRVTIYTDLPEASIPDSTTQKLTIEFRASRGTGKVYCERHFPGATIEETEYA